MTETHIEPDGTGANGKPRILTHVESNVTLTSSCAVSMAGKVLG